MINVNDHLKKSVARIEQLKNQKKSKERREQEAKRKMDTRRYIIIGELVCKYFPDAMKYQPQRSKADNAKEFETFANILNLLADNTELLAKLKKEAAELTLLN